MRTERPLHLSQISIGLLIHTSYYKTAFASYASSSAFFVIFYIKERRSLKRKLLVVTQKMFSSPVLIHPVLSRPIPTCSGAIDNRSCVDNNHKGGGGGGGRLGESKT